MSDTVISIRTDKKLKEEAMKVAKSAGFSLSTLLNAYMHKLVDTKHIDFYAPPEKMTPRLEAMVAEAEAEYKKGEYSGPFELDEAIQHLEKLRKN